MQSINTYHELGHVRPLVHCQYQCVCESGMWYYTLMQCWGAECIVLWLLALELSGNRNFMSWFHGNWARGKEEVVPNLMISDVQGRDPALFEGLRSLWQTFPYQCIGSRSIAYEELNRSGPSACVGSSHALRMEANSSICRWCHFWSAVWE